MTSKNSQARLSPTARLDVTDPASVEALIERTLAVYGRLDGSLNSAGQAHQPAALAELAVGDFDEVIAASAPGVFLAMSTRSRRCRRRAAARS
jgi:NAD(P)-dependent dehydrogenase (short-subunit alcohol dehydrogenase family)